MSLVRFDPERDLLSLRDAMNRLFEESFIFPTLITDIRTQSRGFGVAIDLYETPDQLILKASLPGVKPENVEISVQGDLLAIKGEIKEEEKKHEGKEGRYHYLERRQGSFSRVLTLPFPIQADEAEAIFEQGVLTLTLPKAEEIKTRTIKVREKVHVSGR